MNSTFTQLRSVLPWITARKTLTGLALILVTSFVSACTSSGDPPSPTPVPLTATPRPPTVLITWEAGPVLALFLSADVCQGNCDHLHVFSGLPDMVLYSDGRQIFYENGRLYQRVLTSAEVCHLLIDTADAGYFNYDPTPYRQRIRQVNNNYFLGIYGWKSNEMTLPNFRYTAPFPSEAPPELKAPIQAYHHFMQHTIYQSTLYQPEQLALYLEKYDASPPTYALIFNWNLPSLSLANLWKRFRDNQVAQNTSELILTGAEAQAVLMAREYEVDSWQIVYEEGNEFYGLEVRPLLPYETTGGKPYETTHIPSPDASYSPKKLSCAY